MPAEPARSFFASVIAELATRFDAPVFEPHVTIYADDQGNADPTQALSHTIAECRPFRLSVRDIQYSDEFTKPVFVQFESSPALSHLCRALRLASAGHNKYQLNPHLSLIYKKMMLSAKIDLAASISLPFTEVLFDSTKAVLSPARVESRREVEAWRVAAVRRLPE
jgi:hypothetical protein